MTHAKKLKKQVRERAAKTGESYSAARAHVVASIDTKRRQRTRAAAEKARESSARGTVSEARCVEKTGHGFDHWFGVLDAFGAPTKGHKAAAKHLLEAHEVSAWYAQSITVSYERARGLRVEQQSCAGDFQVSVSRVLPVAQADATAALAQRAKREPWLERVDARIRDAVSETLAQKRVRRGATAHTLRLKQPEFVADLRITAKDDGRSAIAVHVSKLPDRSAVEEHRAIWRGALDAFRGELSR